MMLVDSTVWIDHLRDRENGAVARLRRLLARGEAAVAPVIVQELLQGAASSAALEILRSHFLALPLLEPKQQAATHTAAGELYARCRWAGITPRSPHDCLIARLAIEHGVELLHDDRDFELIARVEPGLTAVRG